VVFNYIIFEHSHYQFSFFRDSNILATSIGGVALINRRIVHFNMRSDLFNKRNDSLKGNVVTLKENKSKSTKDPSIPLGNGPFGALMISFLNTHDIIFYIIILS